MVDLCPPDGNQPERESKRKMIDTRRPSCFDEWDPTALFSKGTYIPYLYIEGNERCKVTQSQPNIPAVLPLSKPGFFCIPFPQKMLCTVSSGLGGLWTFYDPLSIKAAQPENLFSLQVSFLYISNLCQPQKMPNRVNVFHRAKVQWVTRKNQLAQKSDMVKFKATLVFLAFSLC